MLYYILFMLYCQELLFFYYNLFQIIVYMNIICYTKKKEMILMDIWDNLKDKLFVAKESAGKYAKIALDKTNNVVDITKLNISKNDTENKIAKLYKKIGEIVYSEYQNGSAFDGELGEIMIEIDQFTEELSQIKEKISSLKNGVTCSNCGTQNDKDSEFCSKCGVRLTSDDIEEPVEDADNYVEIADSDE